MKMADFNHQHNSKAVDVGSATHATMQRQLPINGPSGDSRMENFGPTNTNSVFNPNTSNQPVKPAPPVPFGNYSAPQNYMIPSSASFNPTQTPNYIQTSMPNYSTPAPLPVSTAAFHYADAAVKSHAMERQQMPPNVTLPQAGNKSMEPLVPGQNTSYPQGGMQNGPANHNGALPPNMRMPAPMYNAVHQRGGHVSYPQSVAASRHPIPPGATVRHPPMSTFPIVNSRLGQVYQSNLLQLPTDSAVPCVGSHSQGSASPSTSLEPGSSKSSRNPSPISTHRYDALEGQFSARPSSIAPSGNAPSISSPPMSGTSSNPNPVAVQTPASFPNNSRNSLINPSANASLGMAPSSLPTPSVGVASNLNTANVQPLLITSQNCSFPLTSASNAVVDSVPNAYDSSSALTGGTPYSIAAPSVEPNQGFLGPIPQTSVVRPGIASNRRQYPQQSAYNQHPVSKDNMPISSQQLNLPPSVSTNFTSNAGSYQPINTHINNQDLMSAQNVNPPSALDDKRSYFRFQGSDNIDLMQHRNILPSTPLEPPKIIVPQHDFKNANCSPEIFRCTLTKIPGTHSLLQKSRLPLGILIHPFKDLNHLPVIQCATIVRCRSCRTYINPFVYFVDNRRWKCNLCFRVNELPEEFLYDPVSKCYGDPARRPEIKSATIEFIAPSEYMLRPPQPAVYLFLLDVSYAAVETEYLRIFCDALLDEIDKLPGDSRTQVGFITYDSSVHFYNLAEGLSQPLMMVVSDVDDIFLPCPDNLLVNLQESKELVQDLLHQLPMKFADNNNPDSALGAALQAAFKLLSPSGGRVTVVQGSIPNHGPGLLKPREDPNQRASKDIGNVGPANDFYKKLSLDCSGQQISVDLFVVATQYVDIATLGCAAKYSGGCIHYYPGFHAHRNVSEAERFENDMRRYLTRKIGFEAVMRIRCTKGLAIHTFHGNFFVRSTDLLSLPNINPDSGFGMQISIEEQLTEGNSACFQAALLYTSSKGERRIRVHTLCLGVTGILSEVLSGADQQAIVGLLAKMAVDRTLMSSLADARDALINACIDPLGIYKMAISSGPEGLMAPSSLYLLPLYILALLKHPSFRVGVCTKLDERVFAMNQMKTLPLSMLMLSIYPNLYPVHALDEKDAIQDEDKITPQPPLLQLTSEKIDSHGAYLLDIGEHLYLYICRAINDQFCQNVLKASNFAAIDEKLTELPELENSQSELLRNFISHLQTLRTFPASFCIIREDSKLRLLFLQHLIEDRSESAFSYYEMLQHIKQQVHK